MPSRANASGGEAKPLVSAGDALLLLVQADVSAPSDLHDRNSCCL